jgi:hypothetical protein
MSDLERITAHRSEPDALTEESAERLPVANSDGYSDS